MHAPPEGAGGKGTSKSCSVDHCPSHTHLYVEVVWNFLSHALYLLGFCLCV